MHTLVGVSRFIHLLKGVLVMRKVKKARKLRRYSVSYRTLYCGFERVHTLSAKNKNEAKKLVSSQYGAQDGNYVVRVLK